MRWGTELHDRFMLPHFVWQDFEDVIAELREAGFPLELDWFAPHFEFRFPVYGAVQHDGIEIELRQALEPWHVLGEEGGAGGHRALRRFVARTLAGAGDGLSRRTLSGDVQRHHGAAEAHRHAWRSGRRRPLPRLAALELPAPDHPRRIRRCVRPLDSWPGRSVGGCRYHVAHPGGRAHDTLPVNALEAETRRLARFETYGHTPGPMTPFNPGPNPSFPHTLDLRRINF